MDSNIIELVKLGHERADELKASCGSVDVRTVAQLISDLASQLEVQYVRAEESQREFRSADITMQNLEAKCERLAAENAYLLPKAASELSNAWVLHKYLIGIQAAIMYLDGGSKKAAQEWLYGTIAGPGFEFPDEVEVGGDIDAWAIHQMRDSISHPRALEIIKAETPATDALLAEVRAQGVDECVRQLVVSDDDDFTDAPNICAMVAHQLRKGAQS
ncbi:hypothetical protein HVZ29_15045 [Escherichia coli]|nr:hypothetical protein HVZ29_15045 [Escherichia coli]